MQAGRPGSWEAGFKLEVQPFMGRKSDRSGNLFSTRENLKMLWERLLAAINSIMVRSMIVAASHSQPTITISLRMKLEFMMFHAKNRNFKSIRTILHKLWMMPSFFPTLTRLSLSMAAFRLPTSSSRLPTFVLLILIFVPWNLLAVDNPDPEPGSLTASLGQTSVHVGGMVWLTLNYRLPEGGRLPDKPKVQGLDELSILKQINEPGQIKMQLLFDQVEPWQSGPIGLPYLDADGQAQLLATEPVSIQPVSNISRKAEEVQLRPIREIVPTQTIWRSTLLWLAVFLALILIGAGLFWWYKRQQKPTVMGQYAEPPDIRARRELRSLESKGYFETGRVKKYYFSFSEIMRRYLESIRGFPAAEYTTEEIARHISAEQDRKLIPLLLQADLVKFADSVPTPARKEEDIKAALAYIRESSAPPAGDQETAHPREVPK